MVAKSLRRPLDLRELRSGDGGGRVTACTGRNVWRSEVRNYGVDGWHMKRWNKQPRKDLTSLYRRRSNPKMAFRRGDGFCEGIKRSNISVAICNRRPCRARSALSISFLPCKHTDEDKSIGASRWRSTGWPRQRASNHSQKRQEHPQAACMA